MITALRVIARVVTYQLIGASLLIWAYLVGYGLAAIVYGS
jgi:hypothetical protein